MNNLMFKKWFENQSLGGGLEPPKESPIDPDPAPGQTNALADFHLPGSDQLPPVKRKMKSKMKK